MIRQQKKIVVNYFKYLVCPSSVSNDTPINCEKEFYTITPNSISHLILQVDRTWIDFRAVNKRQNPQHLLWGSYRGFLVAWLADFIFWKTWSEEIILSDLWPEGFPWPMKNSSYWPLVVISPLSSTFFWETSPLNDKSCLLRMTYTSNLQYEALA